MSSIKRRFQTYTEDQPTAERRAAADAVQYILDEYDDVLRFLRCGVRDADLQGYLSRVLGRPDLTDIATNLHSVDACLRSCEEIHVSAAAKAGRWRVELSQENAEVQTFYAFDPELAAVCCLVAQRQEEVYTAWLLNPNGGYDLARPEFITTPRIQRPTSEPSNETSNG